MGRSVVGIGILGAFLAGWASYRVLDEAPAATMPPQLATRVGGLAHSDEAVAFSLGRMHSYLSLGVPSELVRERILSDRLARSIGRDGRALVAEILDYGREIVSEKPRRQTRKRFFRRLDALNQKLADAGLGYYLYASFEWDDETDRVDEINFDTLDIKAVRTYRVGERTIRMLHVERDGVPNSHAMALGFTAPDYRDEAFLDLGDVEYEVEYGLLPARVPFGESELFSVTDDYAKAAWYQRFRARVAEVMSEDIGVDRASPERARAALVAAVEIHELQHQIDYQYKPPVRGVFRAVADRLQNRPLAAKCMYETSAHLAQLARDPVSARVMLGEIVSYGFTNSCDDPDCLAALVIVDELAFELGGQGKPGQLVVSESYHPRALADRYTTLLEHSPAALAEAAERAWTRVFQRPLETIERVH